MEKLPSPVLKDFLQGQHVMRHQPGLWNAIWSDMYIESTFMRYGHSPGGIIGITLKALNTEEMGIKSSPLQSNCEGYFRDER